MQMEGARAGQREGEEQAFLQAVSGVGKVQAGLRKRRLRLRSLGLTPCLHLLCGGQHRSIHEVFGEVMLGLLALRFLCEPGWIPSCSGSQVLSHLLHGGRNPGLAYLMGWDLS